MCFVQFSDWAVQTINITKKTGGDEEDSPCACVRKPSCLYHQGASFSLSMCKHQQISKI